MKLVWGISQHIDECISAKFPELTKTRPYKSHGAVGLISDDGRLVGGIAIRFLNDFEGSLSIWIDHPCYFPSKSDLELLFERSFKEAGLTRLSCSIMRRNRKARKLVEHLGFKLEGVSPRGFDGKRDKCLYGMTIDNCPWLKGTQDGHAGSS